MKKVFYDKPDEIILEDYADLVKRLAREMYKKIHGLGKFELNDLVQYGWIGLIYAKDHYDCERKGIFEAYAYFCIRGEMFEALRDTDLLTFTQRRQSKKINKAKSNLEQRLGRKPNDNELATEIGIDGTELITIERNSNEVSIVSIEPNYDKDRNWLPIDPPDRRPNQIQLLIDAQVKQEIKIVFSAMTPEIRRIMLDHFIHGITFRELGKSLGLTEHNIGERAKLGIQQIKKRLQEKGYEKHDYLLSTEINITEPLKVVKSRSFNKLKEEFENKNHRKGNRVPRFEPKAIELMNAELEILLRSISNDNRLERAEKSRKAYEDFKVKCELENLDVPSFEKTFNKAFNQIIARRKSRKKTKDTTIPLREKLAA